MYQQEFHSEEQQTMWFRPMRLFVHLFQHKAPRHVTGTRRSPLATILAIIALAVAVTFAVLYVQNKASTATELSAMQKQIAATETQLTLAEDNGTSQFKTINTKLKTINQTISYVTQFTERCPTLADGPDGPAQFWVACSQRLPTLPG